VVQPGNDSAYCVTGACGPFSAEIGPASPGNDSAYCVTGACGPFSAEIGPASPGNDSAYCSQNPYVIQTPNS